MSAALICRSMITAVKAIDPLLHGDLRFTEHDSSVGFAEFCERNPGAVRRRVFIRGDGTFELDTSTADKEYGWTTIQAAVAYPRDWFAGPERGNDLDALIESDMKQLEHTIGINGYPRLEQAVDGCVSESTPTREEGDACIYGLLTMRVGYWRAVQ
mgnify:FL=1